MTTLTIRKISDEVHRALKVRAAANGRSTEAELRLIVEAAVRPPLNLAESLQKIGQSLGGIEIEFPRDKRPFKAPQFE
jgi:antitoxin FitA